MINFYSKSSDIEKELNVKTIACYKSSILTHKVLLSYITFLQYQYYPLKIITLTLTLTSTSTLITRFTNSFPKSWSKEQTSFHGQKQNHHYEH